MKILVNLPNAQALTFGVDHQNPFQIKASDIQDIYRSLDLHTGALTTTMLVHFPPAKVYRSKRRSSPI